jgi:hypothetical protein
MRENEAWKKKNVLVNLALDNRKVFVKKALPVYV